MRRRSCALVTSFRGFQSGGASGGRQDWRCSHCELAALINAKFPCIMCGGCLIRYHADRRVWATGSLCTKHQYQHRRLTAGAFVLYCLDCECCIGFLAMRDAESPRTLFEALYTRWPGCAPLLIVYDNGCHAHAFALNREAAWAAGSTYCIDALHWPGHADCAASYHIKEHPLLTRINSQLCEQRVS